MKKILFGILFFFSLQTFASDVFVLNDIKVAGEGASTIEAQTNAVLQGQKDAFNLLLNKIVNPDTPFSPDEEINIEDFVQDVSLSNEKITPYSYKGDLMVRFKAEPIRNLLNQKNISYLTALPQPMLLVPIFEDETQTLVFNKENPLYTYWSNENPQFDLFKITSVINNDIKLEQAQKAFEAGHFNAYKKLLNEYGVSSVLILHIKKKGDIYEVITTVLPENTAPEAHITLSVSDDRPNLERVVKDLSADAFRNMRKKWIYLSTKTPAPKTIYKMTTPISELADLKRIKDKIQQLNFAEHIEIKGFKNKMLWVDLTFQGSEAELLQKLKLNQLNLEPYTENETDEPIYLLTETVSEEIKKVQEQEDEFTFPSPVQENDLAPTLKNSHYPYKEELPLEIDSLEQQNNINTL